MHICQVQILWSLAFNWVNLCHYVTDSVE